MNDIAICGTTVNVLDQGADLSEWMLFTIVLVAAVAYLSLVILLKVRNVRWRGLHTICFITGIGLLLFAFTPNMMSKAHESFQMHMLQHVLAGMVAPMFAVLGAPITLLLKALPAKSSRSITKLLKTKFIRAVSHPATALILNSGGLFLLYLTPLYNVSMRNFLVHNAVHIHIVLAGYLFTWSIIGIDGVGKRPGFGTKVSVAFISIALHSFLAKLMYAYLYPINISHSIEDIQNAAKFMYYWGDLAEFAMVVVLFFLEYSRRTSKGKIDSTKGGAKDLTPILVGKVCRV